MPNLTNHLKLEKPLQSENYNIDIFNNNSDKIDIAIKDLKDNKVNLTEIQTSANTKYATSKGVKEFTCKSGYVDNINIQGQTKILNASNVEVSAGTSGARLVSVGQGDKIEVLTRLYDTDRVTVLREDKKQISTTLRSLPNGVKDEIVQQGDRYYKIVRCIEGNGGNSTFINDGNYKQLEMSLPTSCIDNVVSNMFAKTNASNTGNGIFVHPSLDNLLIIRTTNSSVTDKASFEKYLSDNNFSFVAELKAPQIIEIPNPNPRTFSGNIKSDYYIHSLTYLSDSWQIVGTLDYDSVPFDFVNPSSNTVIIEILNKHTNAWVRNIVIRNNSTVSINPSDSETVGRICFKSSSGWSESSIPLIESLFPIKRALYKTTFLLNTGVVQGEASFEVTNSLGSALDVLADKVSSLDGGVLNVEKYNATPINGWNGDLVLSRCGNIVTITGVLHAGVVSARTTIASFSKHLAPKNSSTVGTSVYTIYNTFVGIVEVGNGFIAISHVDASKQDWCLINISYGINE